MVIPNHFFSGAAEEGANPLMTTQYGFWSYLRFLILCSVCAAIVTGCKSWSERGAKGIGTLPKALPNESKFSSYEPAHPYQQIAKGLLGRKMYETPAEVGAVIEVHDFLVGPKQRTDSYVLPAPSIFEVKSGSGLLRMGDKPQQISPGMVITLTTAQPFTIENQSDIPIAIRVEILRSK